MGRRDGLGHNVGRGTTRMVGTTLLHIPSGHLLLPYRRYPGNIPPVSWLHPLLTDVMVGHRTVTGPAAGM